MASYVSQAQTNRGSIVGTITDPSGAAVAERDDFGQGSEYRSFLFHNFIRCRDIQLPSGRGRNLRHDAWLRPDFRTEQRTGLIVQINTATVTNVQLTVGQQAEVVTVVAGAPTVESATSDVGAVVSPRQVQQLPLSLGGVGAFRSPEAFTFLVPGVVGPGTNNSSNGIYIQKTSGGQNFGDDVLLDGSSAARPDNNSTFDETAPSVEAISEFRVETATPPAQFGRTTGGIRSFNTSSGTQQLSWICI